MNSCTHRNLLVLMDQNKNRVRCRHCHLTISADELGDRYCPECYENQGWKRYDFEEMKTPDTTSVRYRCEDCGVVIEAG